MSDGKRSGVVGERGEDGVVRLKVVDDVDAWQAEQLALAAKLDAEEIEDEESEDE